MKFLNIFYRLVLLLTLIFFTQGFTNCSRDQEKFEETSKGVFKKGDYIGIMSFNIRRDRPKDGKNQWKYRKEKVLDIIKKYEPAILGLQEAKPFQLRYLNEQLEDYRTIESGTERGEYNAILYNTTMVEFVEESDSFIWLSETPAKKSKGWDASYYRNLMYAKFTNIKTCEDFHVFNTHFDYHGSKARRKSAKLVISTITKVIKTDPIILMGDFNDTKDTKPYSILTSSDSGLKNAFYESKTPVKGPDTRSSGFSVAHHSDKDPIDFIFISDRIKVLEHSFLSDSYRGFYPSDHLPLLIKVIFK